MKKQQRLCLDTSVALHLLNEVPPPGQEQDWTKAHEVAASVTDVPIMLAAPTVAEILARYDDELARAGARQVLPDTFEIIALDEPAAAIAGALAASIDAGRGLGAVAKSLGRTRQQLKVDFLILGCVIQADARVCAFDSAFARVAQRVRQAARVLTPDLLLKGRQGNLYMLGHESRRRAAEDD